MAELRAEWVDAHCNDGGVCGTGGYYFTNSDCVPDSPGSDDGHCSLF